MKRRSGFFILMTLIIIGLTFCIKKNPPLEELPTDISVDFPPVKKQAPTGNTQPATNVSATGATLNGMVNANGLPTTIVYEYGTSTSYGQEIAAEQSPVTGYRNINVSATLTGLTVGTYHFRVKAVNSLGTTYGSDDIFISANNPTLTTIPISEITTHSAVSGGNITDDGGAPITEKGVYWTKYLMANHTGGRGGPSHTNDGTGTGSFTSYLTGLQPSTTYYVTSYAKNSAGLRSNGDRISFTTAPPCDQIPTVTTLAATNIIASAATLNGIVNANGSSTTVTFEYCYTKVTSRGKTTVNLNVAALQSPVSGDSPINVSADISGLISGITYSFRVKADNFCGIVNGENLSFTAP